jgi:hypothetical protein
MAIDQETFDRQVASALGLRRKSDLVRTLPARARVDSAYPHEYQILEIAEMVRGRFYKETGILEFLKMFEKSIHTHMLRGNFDAEREVFRRKRLKNNRLKASLSKTDGKSRGLNRYFRWKRGLRGHDDVRDKLKELGIILLRPSVVECSMIPSVRLDAAWFDPKDRGKMTHAFEVHSQNWDWKNAIANLHLAMENFPGCNPFLIVNYEEEFRDIQKAMRAFNNDENRLIRVLLVDEASQIIRDWKREPKQFRDTFNA